MSASDPRASVPGEGAEVPAVAAVAGDADATVSPHVAPAAAGPDAAPDDPFPLLAVRRRTEF